LDSCFILCPLKGGRRALRKQAMGAAYARFSSAEVIVIGATDDKKKEKRSKKEEKQANKDYAAKIAFLGKVPMFIRLPKDKHPVVASYMEEVRFKKFETVFRQGDIGDYFFMVRSGEAGVYAKEGREQNQVATLKAGDYFGENALLRDEPRTATIIAETRDLVAFRIKRSAFQDLGLQEKLAFAQRRAAVGGGEKKKTMAKEPTPKNEADEKLITDALRNNEYLNSMQNLDQEKIGQFLACMWKETHVAGTEVIKEGDLQADYYYVVAEGRFEVRQKEDRLSADGGNRNYKVVNLVQRGGSFGELALLYFQPRAATVKAVTAGVTWVIDRTNFKSILMQVTQEKTREYVGYLAGVPLLTSLLANEKHELAKALVELHYAQGEDIVKQGEPGSTFYIMYQGTVDVMKDGAYVTTLEASVSRNNAQYFGELSLLENEKRAATITVTSPTAKLLVLDREAFELLLGPLKKILEAQKRTQQTTTTDPDNATSAAVLTANRTKIYRSELSKIGLIGVGGSARVDLVEHVRTRSMYALKTLDKGFIAKRDLKETVLNEKNIFINTNSPFIVRLLETYSSPRGIHFLLEALMGGELFSIYATKGLYGSEPHAKFYAAGAGLALCHLHERKIVWRDLKPENIVLSIDGQMKVVDLGLAKFVAGKTFTTCGTPDYFPPEIITSQGHNAAADWWALGIMIYEFLCGATPFESNHPMQVYAKVMKGIAKISIPRAAENAEGLIKGLLKADPDQRLPMKSGGFINVKTNKWYSEFEWKALAERKMTPPYKPHELKSRKDISNFAVLESDCPPTYELDEEADQTWYKSFATCV